MWDRLSAHRSALVRDHLDSLEGRIHVEYLPAYAPELNPVEYIWAHWKQHELPMCARKTTGNWAKRRRTLRRMRRRPRLIAAFWNQASLWPE